MDRERFEKLVDAAITELPDEFQEKLTNVVVIVERRPSRALLDEMEIPPGDTLFGLYEGTPLTERGFEPPLHPDRIRIFQEPIEEVCENDNEIKEEIRTTIMHEVAHFFGIDDDDLEEMGY
jgi:predicted Zn-dependent protease with MMP-like domain